MPMSKVAVLVVEDMPQARATAVGIMQALGCTVFDAYNGHQALKLLQAHPEIQVLFTDVRMPGMSGTELAETAQRLRPDLRIVLTSGYVGPRDVPADITFVPKPWRMDAIAEAVSPAPLIQPDRPQSRAS
jgi:CheY-like chemotaxis protein